MRKGLSRACRATQLACSRAVAGARSGRKIYTYAVATAMPTDPPGDPPQLEDLLGEPWRAQVTALRRHVRKTRDVRLAELLSLAFEAAVSGDTEAAGRHVAAAALLDRPRPRAARRRAPLPPLPGAGPAPSPDGTPPDRHDHPQAADRPGPGDRNRPGAHRHRRVEQRRREALLLGVHRHQRALGVPGRRLPARQRERGLGRADRRAPRRLPCPALRPWTGDLAGRLPHRAPLPARLAARNTGRMPPQYDLHPRHAGAAPALVTLADLVSARRGELALAHVKGHAGHTLNEGADLLATIARRWVAAAETLPRRLCRPRRPTSRPRSWPTGTARTRSRSRLAPEVAPEGGRVPLRRPAAVLPSPETPADPRRAARRLPD